MLPIKNQVIVFALQVLILHVCANIRACGLVQQLLTLSLPSTRYRASKKHNI